jgi:glycosyltransferase involved in cell wall biosynthesis
MRILLVTPYFPPQNAAASTRTYAFARFWSKAGHEVTVLTTVKRPDQWGFEASFDGFEVVAIPYLIPRFLEGLRARHMASNGSAASAAAGSSPWFALLRQLRVRTGIFCSVRMPDLTDFWIKPALAWVRSRNRGWDCVVSSSGPYTAHLVAAAVKREGRTVTWAADFRDPWTRHHAFAGLFPFTIAERLLERRCLKQVSLVTTVSEELAERFRSKTKAPVAIVSNGYDDRGCSCISPYRIFPDDGRVRLVYTGTTYRQGQEPFLLLQALAEVATADFQLANRLRIVIAGPDNHHWLTIARHLGVADFLEWRGNVSRQDAIRMQRNGDALALLDWKDPRAGVLPSKLFEYLLAASPVLVFGGSSDSAVGRLLQRTGRGVHLGRDVPRIADLLRRLVDRKLDLKLVRNEQELHSFSLEHQAMRYLQLLEHMVSSGHSSMSKSIAAVVGC